MDKSLFNNTKIKAMVDSAITVAKNKYDEWLNDQQTIWNNKDIDRVYCPNSHTEAIIFSGSGRECSMIIDELDKELYRREILPYWEYYLRATDYSVDESLNRILPTFDTAKIYNIWLIYSNNTYTYGINSE